MFFEGGGGAPERQRAVAVVGEADPPPPSPEAKGTEKSATCCFIFRDFPLCCCVSHCAMLPCIVPGNGGLQVFRGAPVGHLRFLSRAWGVEVWCVGGRCPTGSGSALCWQPGCRASVMLDLWLVVQLEKGVAVAVCG